MHRFAWLIAIMALAGCATPTPTLTKEADAGIEMRLQRVEDELAVRRVLIDYAATLDGRDYAAYANVFTADGEWTNAGGSHKGRAAIRAMLEGMFGPAGTPNAANYHIMSNPRVDLDGGHATATSRYLFMVRGAQGSPTPMSAGIYHDDLVRQGGGWKIKRRQVEDIMPTAEDWVKIRAARQAAAQAKK
jgi:uncharacterized protein (TIGR02246 family)